MIYSATVMEHFHNPRYGYRMSDPDVMGQAGKPGAGPFMILYLRLAGDRVREASFQTFGCAPAIAAGSLLADRLRGTDASEAEAWDQDWLEERLGGLPRHKRHCAELGVCALRDALGKRRRHES